MEKAKIELGEDENKRKQALVEFREWIQSHPRIISCRTDEQFLLKFLRSKKYHKTAYSLLEANLTITQKHSKWYSFQEKEDRTRMNELYERGFIYPLSQRDAQGRRVILTNVKNFDPCSYSGPDTVRLCTFITQLVFEEEEAQIAGLVVIKDFAGCSFKYLSQFSISDMRTILSTFQSAFPGRIKEFYAVNLPSCTFYLMKGILKVLHPKIRKRIFLLKNIEELQKYVSTDILPKEYGGKVTEQEMVQIYKKTITEKEHLIKESLDHYIELSN
ncbi:unnamed protein product [Diamesa serratosioi]